MQGNCTGPAPQLRLAHGLRPGQCVLRVNTGLITSSFEWGHAFWWDNIYVLTQRHPWDELTWLVEWRGPRKKLWVTRSTLEGDYFNSSALGAYEGANVFLGGTCHRVLRHWSEAACIAAAVHACGCDVTSFLAPSFAVDNVRYS